MNRPTNPAKAEIEDLKEQVRILGEENALLAERTEDVLLLSLISEAIKGMEDPNEILQTALERTSVLKDISLCACASIDDAQMKIVSSFLTFTHENINGLMQPVESIKDIVVQNSCYLSGKECNQLTWPDCNTLSHFEVSELLAISFTSQFIPIGVFLFACDDNEDNRLARNDVLLHQVVESIVAIVDKFHLIQSLRGINATLDQRVEERTQQWKASESRYRTLVDASKAAIMTLDGQTFIDCNQATLDMFGMEHETQLLQHSPVDLSPQYQPDGTSSAEAAKHYMGITLREGSCRFEWLHQRLDETTFLAEVFLSRIEMDEGYVVQGIVTDISERKQMEDVLRMFYRAAEQSADHVMILNNDYVIEYFNPAACRGTGYAQEEAIGKVAYFARPEVRAKEPYRQIWWAVESKSRWEGKLTDRRKNGSSFPVICSMTVLRDDGGGSHYVCIQKDITDYENLEEQFRQAQKMDVLGTFVGGIAHNFNNLLAGIIGNADLLKASTKDSSYAQKKLANIERLSFDAADIIKQLLAFARKSTISLQNFNFSVFIKEACRLYDTSLQGNIKFQRTLSNEALILHGNATQLQQVLFNLLNNARDALVGREDPSIRVSLEKFATDDAFLKTYPHMKARVFACLSVRDNGAGISKENVQSIFEPFFTTKSVGAGTGLGLAMVYGSIHEHGGVVEVQSEEGEGTCMRVYLPLTEAQEDVITAVGDTVPVRGNGETILLVDDSKSWRESGMQLLESLGYHVFLAENGYDAVTVFNEHADKIDLAIMDIVMPKMGGVEAVHKIREINPDLPVIFATGYDPKSDMNHMMPRQQETLLQKPFSIYDLSRIVSEHINGS